MQFKTDLIQLKKKKFFKVKNSKKEFMCALCKSPRQMRYSKNLSKLVYLRLLLLSAFLVWALYPMMGEKAVLMVLPLWPIVEFTNKILYRKEIPCSYCGFDATWYRRDVKVAKRKVDDFWSERLPNKQEKANINIPKDLQTSEEVISQSPES
jgi:hypothetical protein